MKNLLYFLISLGLLVVTASAERIALGSGKTLLLNVPASWTSADLPAQSPGMPMMGQNVRYVTKSGSNDALLITILPVSDEGMGDPDNLKAMVEMATQQFVTGSVEGKADLREITLGGVKGFAATFTDANLVGKPSVKDDYKALTACYVYLGEHVLVTASLFTDEVGGKAYAEGLQILRTMSLQLTKDKI